MWIRKRLDIGWWDLAVGMARCSLPGNRTSPRAKVEQLWPVDDTVARLSVRSGFDLLLGALDLPRGSEILFSAVTVADMVRIARHHGLTPIPVDLDPATMAPTAKTLHRAMGPGARAVVVAHPHAGHQCVRPHATGDGSGQPQHESAVEQNPQLGRTASGNLFLDWQQRHHREARGAKRGRGDTG